MMFPRQQSHTEVDLINAYVLTSVYGCFALEGSRDLLLIAFVSIDSSL